MKFQIKEAIKRIGKDLKEFAWAGIAFVLYYLLIHAVYGAFCPMLVVSGLPCAGCGITRAVLYLLQGEFARAISVNPSIVLLLAFLLYCGYFRYFRGRKIKGFGAGLVLLAAGMLLIYFYRMYLYFPDRAPYVYHRNNVLSGQFSGYEKWVNLLIQWVRALRGR